MNSKIRVITTVSIGMEGAKRGYTYVPIVFRDPESFCCQ
jgi:hypothetical protein